MKRNKKEKLEKVAIELATLEKECQKGINTQENMAKMNELIKDFSLDELLILDEYILKNLLTK